MRSSLRGLKALLALDSLLRVGDIELSAETDDIRVPIFSSRTTALASTTKATANTAMITAAMYDPLAILLHSPDGRLVEARSSINIR